MSILNYVISAGNRSLVIDQTEAISICEFMWDGFTSEDLMVLSPATTRESILFACYQAAQSMSIWKLRWHKWAKVNEDKILQGLSYGVSDPPSKAEGLGLFETLNNLRVHLFL